MIENPSLETLLQQGHNQLDRGQHQAALETFQQASQLEQQNPQVLYGLGLACFRLEQYQESVEYLNQALQIQPSYVLALARRGLAYRDLKLDEQATADFEQAIQIEPQNHKDWQGRGDALLGSEHWEEAITSYDKAIELQPNYHYAWYYRGNVLYSSERYEEAITNYDKAIELQPDYHDALYYRGVALYYSERYEEAIASFDKAIEIKPDSHDAWSIRGAVLCVALKRNQVAISSFDTALELKSDSYVDWYNRGVALSNLGRYQEAIASYDKAIEINRDFHPAWNNRGWAFFNLKRDEEAFQSWKDGRQHLQSETPDHREGRGELYYSQGQAYYQLGQQKTIPFDDWLDAKDSYEEAFELLDREKLRQRRLQVLQDLVRVCQYISKPEDVQELLRKGTDLLQKLVQELEPKEKDEQSIELKRQFAGFNQLQVDVLAQSPDPTQHIAALELAEERKNTCLGWLQYGRNYQAPRPHYQQMQQLLNSRTAALYWHLSPAALTTFLLKHNQPPQVLQFQPSTSSKRRSSDKPKKPYPPAASQLRELENWLSEWKRDYQNYCNVAETAETVAVREVTPWRRDMEYQLRRLESILNIPALLPSLRDIEQLILIPHRDLHLLPLHYLFPPRFTITYLPSLQLAWNLPPPESNPSLLNLENPHRDLHFATVAAIVVSWLYPQCQLMEISALTKAQVIDALKANTGTFQFTGHAYHDIEHPKESALLLANQEKLTLADIFETLNFGNYNLVFLSACETGITSSQSLIDEYVGLVSAFLAKGASYVISTLWIVDELSTALLMIRFYQHLKAGATPALALKQAQDWLRQLTYPRLAEWYLELAQGVAKCDRHCSEYLETLAQEIQTNSDKMMAVQPPFAHPYHWAGFIVTGKPF